MSRIEEIDGAYIARTYSRAKVCFVRGEGSLLYDESGREYIDFSSGIAVNGLGHANPGWLAAVTEQAARLAHVSNLYYSRPCAELAAELVRRSGMSRVFFCNSGAEANECAVKTARKFAFDAGRSRNSDIITLKNSFHGRTMLTLTATGQEELRKPCFEPYMPGFVYAEAESLDSVRSALSRGAAAVIMEPVQGEGGVVALSPEFARGVEALCREHDALLIVDEVQTGNGRTGSLFAYQCYGLSPDIVTTAKGLGNGLPIGAVLFSEKTADTLGPGDHGSTFGGNPIACAGALAVLKQLDDELLADVERKGEYIARRLRSLSGVKSVTGLGLMLGIETDNAAEKVGRCLDLGLVTLTAHGKIRLLPPLNIDRGCLERGLAILEEVLK